MDRSRADIDAINKGDTAAVETTLSADLVDRISMISQDDNPLHMEEEVARELGFPRRVAHGLLAVCAISRLIGTKLPGPGSLWIAQDLQFTSPVFVGDRIRASVTVERVSRAARIVILRVEVRDLERDSVVLSGTTTVKIPLSLKKEAKRDMETTVALVTGSSRGLGRAIALALGKQGLRVVVHYRSRTDEAEAVVQEINASGGSAVALQADLSIPAQVERLYVDAVDAFGPVDVLVNNATLPVPPTPLMDVTWEEIKAHLDIYVGATLRLVQLAAPSMKERKYGRIVNVLTSYAVGRPPPKLTAYVTAKSALAGLSRCMAVELGASNVTVNMVAPSFLVTDLTADSGDRVRQLTAAKSPMKRLAELEEVAETVLYLIGEGAGFMTGAVLPLTGGETMV